MKSFLIIVAPIALLLILAVVLYMLKTGMRIDKPEKPAKRVEDVTETAGSQEEKLSGEEIAANKKFEETRKRVREELEKQKREEQERQLQESEETKRKLRLEKSVEGWLKRTE
jgi:FtsZ-interacting cell division protein ZipA